MVVALNAAYILHLSERVWMSEKGLDSAECYVNFRLAMPWVGFRTAEMRKAPWSASSVMLEWSCTTFGRAAIARFEFGARSVHGVAARLRRKCTRPARHFASKESCLPHPSVARLG